jgi:hypothetical protein
MYRPKAAKLNGVRTAIRVFFGKSEENSARLAAPAPPGGFRSTGAGHRPGGMRD